MSRNTTRRSIALALLVNSSSVHAHLQKRLDNGLAVTPPMGWDSYNVYSCEINESVIRSNAQAIVDLGLAELGYHYVTTDCGWTTPYRTANGTLTWNTTLFPSGFPATGDFIHSLGLGFGVYSDGGVQMCATPTNSNQTGSLYHESTDAETFASWGADLLKYDNCYSSKDKGYPDADYTPTVSPEGRMAAMSSALNATGRDILYQICEWGLDFPSAWAPPLGNTWRVTNDIIPAWRTIFRIVNQIVPQTSYAGPEHWLDLDMLEIGNNIFTGPEEQTHFSLWAIMKSPLVMGAALKDTFTSINPASLAVLSNKDAISFNQDSLGVAANLTRRYSEAGLDTWAGLLSVNRTVVAFINWNNETVDATLDLPDIGLQSAGYAKDVWNNKTVQHIQTSYQSSIAAHGTLLLELGDTQPAGYYLASDASSSDGLTSFSNIYGITSSSAYTMTVTFGHKTDGCSIEVSSHHQQHSISHTVKPGRSSITVPLTLISGNNNTVSISTTEPITSVQITNPVGTFYPASAFNVSGEAQHIDCTPGLCAPVGSKIGFLARNGSASLSVTRPSNVTAVAGPKYVELTYINNDVAISTSWTTGTNTRNITIGVNEVRDARLEVPLSGRSSELYSPMLGWGDSAVLGLLVDGFGTGAGGVDSIVVGNVGGNDGVQPNGADFVGVRVLW